MTRLTKTLLVALTLSLVANFAALGFIGVRVAKDYAFHSIVDDTAIGKAMPKEVQDAFSAQLHSEGFDTLKRIRSLRKARKRQHELITAEQFDAPAVEKAQNEVRVAAADLVALLQNAFRTSIADLPQNVRQQIPANMAGRSLLERVRTENGE